MGPIIDKVRKVKTSAQVIADGPGHVGFWFDAEAGALVYNDNGTVTEVGSGGGGGSGDTLDLRTSAPSGTANAAWVEHTGTSPTMTISLKARISTVVYTVASVTV